MTVLPRVYNSIINSWYYQWYHCMASNGELTEKLLLYVMTVLFNVVLLYRVGLFTPDMAFEVIVKNQIRKLSDPSIKCIDMVMTELLDMIKQCAILVCEM